MDITEVISHQHDEQRGCSRCSSSGRATTTRDSPQSGTGSPILLETHAEAEERFFYPELLRLGTGGADAESVEEEVEDAVKDHNEIRTAIRKVARCRTGLDRVVDRGDRRNVHNSDHMGEEERQDLADFRQQASLELRHEIAVQFLRYESLKAADRVAPVDKDPKRYVSARQGAPTSATAQRAARAAQKATKAGKPARKAPSKKSSAAAAEE